MRLWLPDSKHMKAGVFATALVAVVIVATLKAVQVTAIARACTGREPYHIHAFQCWRRLNLATSKETCPSSSQGVINKNNKRPSPAIRGRLTISGFMRHQSHDVSSPPVSVWWFQLWDFRYGIPAGCLGPFLLHAIAPLRLQLSASVP